MKRIFLCIFFLLIYAVLSPRSYTIFPTPVEAQNASPGSSSASPEGFTTSTVAAYVKTQAIEAGISPAVANWIVSHESQLGENLVGDDGQSLGYWMISTIFHPEVPPQCSMDLACSTEWSLNWIKAGHINQWSTWKYRYKWYGGEIPPTQVFL